MHTVRFEGTVQYINEKRACHKSGTGNSNTAQGLAYRQICTGSPQDARLARYPLLLSADHHKINPRHGPQRNN